MCLLQWCYPRSIVRGVPWPIHMQMMPQDVLNESTIRLLPCEGALSQVSHKQRLAERFLCKLLKNLGAKPTNVLCNVLFVDN